MKYSASEKHSFNTLQYQETLRCNKKNETLYDTETELVQIQNQNFILSYSVIGPKEPWIDYTMRYVAMTNNINYANDIIELEYGSSKQYNDHFIQNPNSIQMGIIFCTSEWPIEYEQFKGNIPCTFDKLQDQNKQMVFYSIVSNITSSFNLRQFESQNVEFNKNPQTVKLKMDLDNGITQFYNRFEYSKKDNFLILKNTNLTVYNIQDIEPINEEVLQLDQYQSYPIYHEKDIHDVASEQGGFLFIIPYLILYIQTINDLLREKKQNLRMGVYTMGVRHFSYWYSLSRGYKTQGEGFSFSDLFQQNKGKITTLQGVQEFVCPSVGELILCICILCLVTLGLAFYFDNEIKRDQEKKNRFYLFLHDHYWWCKKKLKSKYLLNNFVQQEQEQEQDIDDLYSESIIQERQKIKLCQENKISTSGIRVMNLKKIFEKKNQKNQIDYITAFQNMYFEVEKGELLSILGHNGAGKSSLINVLTGIYKPSSGTASVLGFDLLQDQDIIRQLTGVCPQHDILWDELTVAEHLYMYSKIKGIQVEEEIQNQINQRLQEVNLSKFKHFQVQHLSGGQKRRVSLSIAAIGNPKLIFLDEPTSGMDPKTRFKVWESIKQLKKDRCIILTTHSMREAEYLSDRIAIQSQGQLKCIGTSLYLKNKYGYGYRLSLIVEEINIEQVIHGIQELLPCSRVIDKKGGSLIISLQQCTIQDIQSFFKILEENKQNLLSQQIINWGLCHSSLEDVFFNVTDNQQKLYEYETGL